MKKRIVVLGGGTGGTLVANRLRRALDASVDIVVVDRDDRHVYQPGLLFVPFGAAAAADLVRSRSRQLRAGIEFRRAGIERVELDEDRVVLDDGDPLGYDALIVASGASLRPDETEGLSEALAGRGAHSFYTLEGSAALSAALAGFDGGRLVVNVVDMPIKCPVAPIEFSFLADWYFRQRGIRKQVTIVFATPLDGAFTKQVCNRELSGLLEGKGIEVVTEFNTGEVDGPGRRLVSYDGREIPFDLAVVVPLHGGASYVDRSEGLGSEFGFVPADEATLQSRARPNVFVVGDAADIPVSKAGSVAHFEGDIVARNVCSFLAGQPLAARFDGHTNCFIESGHGKALLIDYNYEIEPVPGRYPSRVGLPLLRESRLNHMGKLAFQQLYWHGLLPGLDIPGIGTDMPHAGKHLEVLSGAG
ncbi:NAD(P)/FAD-dependent oxidoreductase [Acidiferrimicrobium sp. IK]|uniref:type III sulfide quinone reductase, selenoprotein subtype n=1 Tax=Acidiferrimicrobium sp. IK TaxID=2871700 RepID=UPI0021CB5712|nr:FAD/NAD(P)-binding oxidoreductase [Acidiferrimicrobium sp. IK]MCU4182761.1 NAD(P)/FAD-dependent oxidoreductase [Acidiferrimicrobium sp. IK]